MSVWKRLAIVFSVGSCLGAQPKLQVKVYTSGDRGFAVNSTIIYGDRDAILIDTQFLANEAQDLATLIKETNRNLTTVYITHGHPDHYFGLAVIKPAFPNAKIVAAPTTITGIMNGWDARRTFWMPEFGSGLPPAGAILPSELPSNPLMLEGADLQIVGGLMGDAPNNTYVWIPSIRTVIAGDIVFSGTHFTVPKNHDDWFKTLDKIAALKPKMIVPGHQSAGAKNDLSAISFMKKYMLDWDKALAASHSAEELKGKMKKAYPGLGLERLLNSAADAAFAPAKK
jgi:glyoxylase-like metal-dependent hydrolase (beta-lactamase superfamily II)